MGCANVHSSHKSILNFSFPLTIHIGKIQWKWVINQYTLSTLSGSSLAQFVYQKMILLWAAQYLAMSEECTKSPDPN